MKKLCLILTNVLALAPAGWCAYAEKENTTVSTNYIAEPVLAPRHACGAKTRAQLTGGRLSLTTETCRTKCCPTATSNRSTNTG
jgi:hypothetical protein